VLAVIGPMWVGLLVGDSRFMRTLYGVHYRQANPRRCWQFEHGFAWPSRLVYPTRSSQPGTPKKRDSPVFFPGSCSGVRAVEPRRSRDNTGA
jgi:hypothetical protein